jgi:hypothetical protein
VELAVKLEAALVKYLQSLDPSPFPAWFTPALQIKPGENNEDLDRQYLRGRAGDNAEEEYPLDTGNFWWPCEVEVLTPSDELTEAEEASAEESESTPALEKHQTIAAILETAILVDDLPEKLTAAAASLGAGYELTVMAVQSRQPVRSQDNDIYSSGWTVRVYCCSRAFV